MSRTESIRERNKDEKRERLRRAAWELFTRVGYDKTTTAAIARRANVASGTVFLYARDKPDLLFLVFEHRLAKAVDAAFASAPQAAPLIDQVLHIFARMFAMYQRSHGVGRHFVKELPGASGPNAARVHALTYAFLQRLAILIEAAQRRGEVRADAAPVLAAHSMFALYFMALYMWLGGATTLRRALDTFLRPSLELLVRGLRP